LAIGGTAAIAGLFWAQKAGLFRMLFDLLRVLRWRAVFLEKRKAKLLQIDATIAGFYRTHPQKFYASTGCYFAGWLLDSLEVYLVGYLVGMPISWMQALVVEAFTGLAKALGMWIPGSLGVQESGIVLVGRLVGLPDTLSAGYALIRRARELIFAGAGLSFLFANEGLRRPRPAHAVPTS
jgi:uncharacterized membrane protein YbhN (UPF0104 family)